MIARYLSCLLLTILLSNPDVSVAQNHYPLELIRPLAVGAAGTGLDANNRVYKAQQGVTYDFYVAAIGGRWPYTYSLSNAPSGMTIVAGPCTDIGLNCNAGLLTWLDPQSTASNVQVTVCDADNDCVNATWTITVSSTQACFADMDDGNDTTGDGTVGNPWKTLSKAVLTCAANKIVYLRGSTADYNLTGFTITTGTCVGDKIELHESNRPLIWLAYPGESPVVDMDIASKPCLRVQSKNLWFDGITWKNGGNKVFELSRFSNYGATFSRNRFTNFGPGVGEANPAAIMYGQLFSGCPSPANIGAYFDYVGHNRFDNSVGSGLNSAMRMYSWEKGLVEHNLIENLYGEEALAVKGAIRQYTIRANVIHGITDDNQGAAIWGNMQGCGAIVTYGEILHNNIYDTAHFNLVWNQSNEAGPTHVYRNTFQGIIRSWNVYEPNGPLYTTQNVIINSQSTGSNLLAHEGTSCPNWHECYYQSDLGTPSPSTVIVSTNNLGALPGDGAVSAEGLLQGSYRTTYLGTRGWELGTAARRLGLSGGARLFGTWRIP